MLHYKTRKSICFVRLEILCQADGGARETGDGSEPGGATDQDTAPLSLSELAPPPSMDDLFGKSKTNSFKTFIYCEFGISRHLASVISAIFYYAMPLYHEDFMVEVY